MIEAGYNEKDIDNGKIAIRWYVIKLIVASFIYLMYSIFRLYSSSIKSVKDIEDVYNYTETLGLGHFNENIYLSDNSYFKEIEYN